MARQSEFYKGRRKKRNIAFIPVGILVLVFGVLLVLFYSMQKYATITEDEIKISLPFMTDSTTEDNSESSEAEEKTFEAVDVSIQFDDTDYSGVEATAGKGMTPVRAIFVPYEDVNSDSIPAYADRLSTGNALVLELKKEDGYLAWYSETQIAGAYGLNMNTADAKQKLQDIVDYLKDRKIYLVAQISCLQDELLGAHCTTANLRNAYGSYYTDENGYWLDPYSEEVRNYTVQLVEELYEMGFDEVVLSNVSFPVLPETEEGSETEAAATEISQINFSREMSTTPTAVDAVSSYILYVTDQLSNRDSGKYLSCYLSSSKSLAGKDEDNGQDGELFFKIFDRVYYETDRYAYTFNLEDVTPLVTVGSVKNRFVPVVINYLPDNNTWVLVDLENS